MLNVMENIEYLPYSEGLFKTNQGNLKPKKVSPRICFSIY